MEVRSVEETGAELEPAVGKRRRPPRGEDGRAWIENRPSGRWWPRFDLRELWSSREIALVLALRNVKTRYKQTVLGVAWTILQPLAAAAIFTLVFGRVAGLHGEGVAYPLFVYSGLVAWLYFSSSAQLSSESLAQYRELVTKVYFPRLHAPLASVLPGLVDLAVSVVVVGVMMAVYGVAPSIALIAFPGAVLALVAFAFGVGAWLSALNVRYRDVRNALTFLLQLWFFATPVVYGSSLLEDRRTMLLALNPMAGIVEVFRWSLVGTPAPGAWVVGSFAVGVLVTVSGVVYFARVQRRFADVI